MLCNWTSHALLLVVVHCGVAAWEKASKGQVPVGKRSLETSSLFLPHRAHPQASGCSSIPPRAPPPALGPATQRCAEPSGPEARSRSASSATPHPPGATARANKIRGSASRRGGKSWSPFEASGDTRRPPSPRRTRRRSPFPVASTLPRRGAGPRGSAALPLPFRAAAGSEPSGGGVRPAVRSPSGSRRSAPAARARRQLPGWVSGARGRLFPAPRAYLPIPADGLAAGALRHSLSPLPRAASLPLPAGWAPPPPLRDRSAARSPAALRGVARPALGGGEAGRGGWARRWGAGGAPREEGVSDWRGWPKPGGELGQGGGENPARGLGGPPTPAAPLDSLDRATLGCPACVRRAPGRPSTSNHPPHL
ncbi:translation initiation factor IF-2-like [Canis lupus familiaris]|uniref:translation initiation factor IF-2-like n=1 Tax=Canis lupus familiaris TaxID=9615 RepID=UPI0018F7DD4B|nr:translation initiation factor IF-2-like [Canis lupus familiaris]